MGMACRKADLASTWPDAAAVTVWVEGYSGCAGVLSSGVHVGSAGCFASPRLWQMHQPAWDKSNEGMEDIL